MTAWDRVLGYLDSGSLRSGPSGAGGVAGKQWSAGKQGTEEGPARMPLFWCILRSLRERKKNIGREVSRVILIPISSNITKFQIILIYGFCFY